MSFMLVGGCATNMQVKTGICRNEGLTSAGGFWEGYSALVPSNYYGFTFVESRAQLLGTCFQGGKDGIRLYYLEKCALNGNHFEGWKTYPAWNLGEKIEGTFDGDECHIVEYYTEGHADIILHRVHKLSKSPNVFLDPSQRNP